MAGLAIWHLHGAAASTGLTLLAVWFFTICEDGTSRDRLKMHRGVDRRERTFAVCKICIRIVKFPRGRFGLYSSLSGCTRVLAYSSRVARQHTGEKPKRSKQRIQVLFV